MKKKMKDNLSFTNEQLALLSFVSLDNKKFDGKVNWQVLSKESLNQGCFLNLLPHVSGDKIIIRNSTRRFIAVKAGAIINHNYALYFAESEIVSAFNNVVKYVILKGSSSAEYYDNPKDRIMGDIDIFIENVNLPKAISLLRNLGYVEFDVKNDHHIVFLKNVIFVELHNKVAGEDDSLSEDLKNVLANIIDTAVIKSPFEYYNIPAPEDKAQAIILLLHMRHHFYMDGLGLRHLSDWAHFVDKTSNAAFWQELLPEFNKSGLLGFVKALSKACAMFLGSSLPDWAQGFPDEICNKVMREIFLSGNFGAKNQVYQNSNVFMVNKGDGGRIKKLFKAFNQSILGNYPFVKKWFILYPFLAIYKALKYGFQVLFRKRSSLTALKKSAIRREGLICEIEQNV